MNDFLYMRLIWSDIIDLTCGSSDQYHSAFYLIERIFQWMVFTVEIFIKESSFTRKMIHQEKEDQCDVGFCSFPCSGYLDNNSSTSACASGQILCTS